MTRFRNVSLLTGIGVFTLAAIAVPLSGCKHASASPVAAASQVTVAVSDGSAPAEAGARSANPAPAGTDVKCTVTRQYLVVIDISSSRNDETLAQDKEFLKAMIQNLCLGDQIVLQQVHYNGPHDDAKHWSQTMPSPASSDFVAQDEKDRLAETIDAVKEIAPRYFNSNDGQPVQHTDLFATLNDIGEFAGDGGNRSRIILLLSDMLQSADGIEMQDQARMPPPDWIERKRNMGNLPSFSGACVYVVGGDQTPAVKNFWKAYFTATGASLTDKNYRSTVPLQGAQICN
jgi:hypothetical protein